MIYDVRVLTPEGKVKKIVKVKTLMNQIWKQEGLSTRSFKEMNAEAKAKALAKADGPKKKCKYCPTLFSPRFPTSLVCKSKACKQRHYRELGAAPKIEKICIRCKKPFKGNQLRIYCNNPCKYSKKFLRKEK